MMALGATDGPVEKNFSLNSQAMSHDEYRGDIDDPPARPLTVYEVLLALPQYR